MTLLTTHNPIRPLPQATAKELMHLFIDQDTDPLLVGACLALMAQRAPEAQELHAFAEALLEVAVPFPKAPIPVLDTCGTGGDGAGTANLSTLAALLLAHMGVPVIKHGNRAATSTCGSADLLESLGYDLNRTAEQLHSDVATLRFAFLFAPAYHPLLGRVKEIRKRLGVPTIFNVLGPLLNPARPELQSVGVAREDVLAPMAEALARLGVRRAFLVHGKDAAGRGLDEASTEGPTIVFEVMDGRVLPPQKVTPQGVGVPRPEPGALKVADRAEALSVAVALGQGRGNAAFRPAVADAVALQAGLGLLLHQERPLTSLSDAFQTCRSALDEGFVFPLPAKQVQA